MKKLPALLTTIAILSLAIGASTQERIHWITDIHWDVQPDGSYTQPGKRNDGVVVWREIHPATTNSPAEDYPIIIGNTNLTNIWICPGNLWYGTNGSISMTNIVPLLNGMTPENTNDWGKYRMKLDRLPPTGQSDTKGQSIVIKQNQYGR